MLDLLIKQPFGYVLEFFYEFFNNYGIALILFSLAVKLIMLPLSAKSKKSMMKTSRIQPKVKQLEIACGDDKQKFQAEVRELYKEEGVSMTGGCLWSLLPLLILLPLYSVIRYPLEYMLHFGENSPELAAIKTAFEAAGGKTTDAYWQLRAAASVETYIQAIDPAVANYDALMASFAGVKNINFMFLGIDLSLEPSFKFWQMRTWKEIGGFLLPLVSGGLNYLSMFVSQRLNGTVIRDDKGEKDEAAAKSAAGGKVMTYMMPLMSVWFGFIMPLGLSIYWIANSALGMVQDAFLTIRYRKIYDAEDAVKREKAAARAAEEAEKERIRAAKRAANPDGIVENTSKKKQQQRAAQEKEAAAKDYAAKKRAEQGLPPEESEQNPGAEPNRPYARGRAYQADRYEKKEN